MDLCQATIGFPCKDALELSRVACFGCIVFAELGEVFVNAGARGGGIVNKRYNSFGTFGGSPLTTKEQLDDFGFGLCGVGPATSDASKHE